MAAPTKAGRRLRAGESMKLLIVDDEYSTRNRVRSQIDWKRLGIDAVEAVEGSEAALELSRDFDPDILLTDVRMPNMNGIELARELSSRNEHLKIIFLSGYSNREYLKNAISLGAVSYVEKPIDTEELTAAIDAAARVVRREREVWESLDELRRSRHREEIQQLVLALRDRREIDAATRALLEAHVPEFEDTALAVTIVIREVPDRRAARAAPFTQRIVERVRTILSIPRTTIIAALDRDEVIAHVLGAPVASLLEIRRHLQHVCGLAVETMQVSGHRVVIGVGAIGSGVSAIHESSRTARLAADQAFYLKRDAVCYFSRESEAEIYPVSEFQLGDFGHALRRETASAAVSLVTGLTATLKQSPGTSPDAVRKLYFSLAVELTTEAERNGVRLFESIGDTADLWNHLESLDFLDDVSAVVVQGIHAYYERLHAEFTDNRVVNRIIRFIHKNYADSQLCITMIGDALGLSSTYLSHLFKDVTGGTLNAYITDYRVRKAKEIIGASTGTARVKEIARLVGYQNGSYFSHMFKKRTGQSPAEYRDTV